MANIRDAIQGYVESLKKPRRTYSGNLVTKLQRRLCQPQGIRENYGDFWVLDVTICA